MVNIKSAKEIELMRHAGYINYLTRRLIEKNIRPGITTKELDKIAYDYIIENGCTPSFLGYEGFPASICTSINEEVVHGIPGNRKLKNGDIISVDIGVIYKGYHSDAAETFAVGTINEKKAYVIEHTKKALEEGIKQVRDGAKIGDISNAIETYAHHHHLGVVEELVGHGIGNNLHEDPDVPNYGPKGKGLTLREGMTIAIEPMLNLGTKHVYLLDNDWTVVTADNKPSAHFEHTVLVTKDGSEILTKEG